MQKEITLLAADGVTEVNMAFRSTAATQIWYKNVFRRSIIKDMTAIANRQKADGEEADGETASAETANSAISFVKRLAYIMYESAEGNAVRANYDAFLAWLDSLDETSLISHAHEIVSIYQDTARTESTPKNPPAQLNAN